MFLFVYSGVEESGTYCFFNLIKQLYKHEEFYYNNQ